MGSSAPPRPAFALSVGVTGHRSGSLGANAGVVAARVEEVVSEVKAVALELFAANSKWFAEGLPRLSIVSPLADGADQIAAEAAIANGYALQVVLPFPREQTRGEVMEAFRADFDRLANSASRFLELPGNTAKPLDAYVMAGRAVVAHSDLLIAVWDGEVPRGRGGTGEVVELALSRGTPIVHVPVDADKPVALLWSAYDPAVVTLHSDYVDRRPFDRDHLAALLDLLLAPPRDDRERACLTSFWNERAHQFRARVEYPLLLATAGVAGFGAKDFRAARTAAMRDAEWQRYCEACADRHGVNMPLDLLGDAHGWSDQLANHFAQNYHSGHVLNFSLAALAVVIGFAGFMLPGSKLSLAAIEFVLALIIILNTHFGLRHEWHRRWLDYRQLAERLRPLKSLKLLGIAAPDAPGSPTNPVARRWIDWYAAAVWRASGCPAGRIAPDAVPALAELIAAHEVDPQVDFHQQQSREIMLLDYRLGKIGSAVFWTILLISAATIVAMLLDPGWVQRWQYWLTLVSAGLPAIGAAIFGIRFQGDFGASALRSNATAASLFGLARELRSDNIGLMRAADLGEQAARAMFSDLSEWRLVDQQHGLSSGS